MFNNTLITSTYISNFIFLFFALITSATITALNVPRIRSKAKNTTEIIFLFVTFVFTAYCVFYSTQASLSIVFAMLNLSSVIITCFLKCRTYLNEYSLKKAIKCPEILPFLCVVSLYIILFVIIILVFIFASIAARSM